jgi:hypothetical protein
MMFAVGAVAVGHDLIVMTSWYVAVGMVTVVHDIIMMR